MTLKCGPGHPGWFSPDKPIMHVRSARGISLETSYDTQGVSTERPLGLPAGG